MTPNEFVIDFSAHDAWDKCPGLWYEKYCNRRRRAWGHGQRDDALALGSMVHEGLRVWQQDHRVEIPQAVIEELQPTRECLALAQELVQGYTRVYPEEYWPLVMCEEPVTWVLQEYEEYWCRQDNRPVGQCAHSYEPEHYSMPRVFSLAKIDSYFYVPEPTEIETGVPGLQCTLEPGWWIHEYKTKSPYIPIGTYMQAWEMGAQANYQLLALQHHMNKRSQQIPRETQTIFDAVDTHGYGTNLIRGILVNVLEKPRRYIPQRTCKACKEKYEFATWVPTGEGTYACPVCGNRQELKALKDPQPQVPPAYYRFLVTRTVEELERAQVEIRATAREMIAMSQGGLHSHPWHHATCVDTKWNRACEYFGPHKHGYDTRDSGEYEAVPEYRGLVQIEEKL